MVKLRDFLECLNENELVAIVHKHISDGAFSVKEIFEKNDDILDMIVPKNGVEIYREKAEQVVAENSVMRNELFQRDKEISYIIIEVQDK